MEENLFRSIPRVDELLDRGELKASALSQTLLRESVREELDALRGEVRGGRSSLPETDELCARILARAEEKQMPSLRTVINATGVTLHTNLGRACLRARAANAAAAGRFFCGEKHSGPRRFPGGGPLQRRFSAVGVRLCSPRRRPAPCR